MKKYQKGFIIPLVWGIVALLAIGLGTYIFINHHSNTPTVNQIKNNTAITSDSSMNTNVQSTSTRTSIIYTDTINGYQINLPSDWVKYRVVNSDNNTQLFQLPTNDETWTDETNKNTGYATVFTIQKYTLANWSKMKTDCGIYGGANWGLGCFKDTDALGKNSDNFFVVTWPNSGPDVGGDTKWHKLRIEILDSNYNGTNYLKNNFIILNSTQNQTSLNENASGIIKSVYMKYAKNYLDIDYVEFVPGGPNGVRMENNNPKIRTLEISNDAKFSIRAYCTDKNNCTENAKETITFDQFFNIFNKKDYSINNEIYLSGNPWDIVVKDNLITSITEHFIP